MVSGKNIFILVISGLCLIGCTKNNEQSEGLSCGALINALVEENEKEVGKQIEAFCRQLVPLPPASDTAGLSKQLDKLISLINQDCEVNASVVCYGCIKTLPPQSEIKVAFNHNGQIKHKILDISSPANHALSFVSMHD